MRLREFEKMIQQEPTTGGLLRAEHVVAVVVEDKRDQDRRRYQATLQVPKTRVSYGRCRCKYDRLR